MTIVVMFITVMFATCSMLAQNGHAFEPSGVMQAGWDSAPRLNAALGMSITFVPRPIAEEEIRQIPLLEARIRYNLPWNFSANAHIGTNYITNLVRLGGQWSYRLGEFSVALGDEATMWYGVATMDGFDVSAIGWLNSPYVSVGLKTSEMELTLRAEFIFLTARSTRVGDIEIASDKNQRLGASVGVYVEQPFVRNTSVLLGLKLNSLRNAYQAWLAFATFNDPLVYPELNVGVIL